MTDQRIQQSKVTFRERLVAFLADQPEISVDVSAYDDIDLGRFVKRMLGVTTIAPTHRRYCQRDDLMMDPVRNRVGCANCKEIVEGMSTGDDGYQWALDHLNRSAEREMRREATTNVL